MAIGKLDVDPVCNSHKFILLRIWIPECYSDETEQMPVYHGLWGE